MTLDRFAAIRAEAQELFHAYCQAGARHTVHKVQADLAAVEGGLRGLHGRARRFLELGSGVGAITILAAEMGYEACGIEVDPELHRIAEDFARRIGSRARFACGSFVPSGFAADLERIAASEQTIVEGAPAYDELGLDLDDFDLIYAFPWPEEEALLHRMVRRHADPDALFMTYGSTEGLRVFRGGEPVEG